MGIARGLSAPQSPDRWEPCKWVGVLPSVRAPSTGTRGSRTPVPTFAPGLGLTATSRPRRACRGLASRSRSQDVTGHAMQDPAMAFGELDEVFTPEVQIHVPGAGGPMRRFTRSPVCGTRRERRVYGALSRRLCTELRRRSQPNQPRNPRSRAGQATSVRLAVGKTGTPAEATFSHSRVRVGSGAPQGDRARVHRHLRGRGLPGAGPMGSPVRHRHRFRLLPRLRRRR